MAEVVLSNEDLTVFGGPVSLSVDVDFGPTGPRGSRIYGVSADPRLATTEKPAEIQNYDIAMVISPSEPDYLTVYQKTGTNAEEWIQFASLVPNVYSVKTYITFNDGIAIGAIPASDLFTLDDYIAENFMVQAQLENANPMLNFPSAIGISLEIQDVGVKKYLVITATAAELNPSTGWQAVDGQRVAHLLITTTDGILDEVSL